MIPMTLRGIEPPGGRSQTTRPTGDASRNCRPRSSDQEQSQAPHQVRGDGMGLAETYQKPTVALCRSGEGACVSRIRTFAPLTHDCGVRPIC
ncbi:MAG: hypothetical protein RL367_2361 [Pseudomonadota bacterium]